MQRHYSRWYMMMSRCYDPRNAGFRNYGGRGIDVCPLWRDYFVFRNWCDENLANAHLTVDRKDNDKGYSPNNCCAATRKEQAQNRRVTSMRKAHTKLMRAKSIVSRYRKFGDPYTRKSLVCRICGLRKDKILFEFSKAHGHHVSRCKMCNAKRNKLYKQQRKEA